jgi:hypothetical protein
MGEVFAEDLLATGGFGGGQDGGVPIGSLEAVPQAEGVLEDRDRIILDAETQPLLDEALG